MMALSAMRLVVPGTRASRSAKSGKNKPEHTINVVDLAKSLFS
jgi:hypothetical protein